jgi:hypothetical protein
MGAGTTGPFLVLRVDWSRLGVGRPLGSVLRVPRDIVSGETAATDAAASPVPSSRPFLRPSSFTVARLLRRESGPERVPIGHASVCALDLRLPQMDGCL